MNIRSRGFVAAMEDDGEVVEVASSELPAELHEEASEVDGEAQDVVDDVTDVEAAVSDAETLDNIADVAEASAEEGEGMDPVSAEIAEVAVEAIYARLGLTKKATPSMEAFGSTGSRKAATRIAVEDWRDTVKRVWEGVKKFFATIWEKIKELYEKFVGLFRNLEKAAEAMKAKAMSLEGAAKEATMENASVAKAFGAAGSVNASAVDTVLEGQKELMVQAVEASKVSNENISKLASEMAAGKSFTSVGAFKTENKKKLINGNKLTFEIKDEKASFDVEEGKDKENTKVAVLKKDEMVKVCDSVISLAKEIDAYKKVLTDLQNMSKQVTKAAENISAAMSKDSSVNEARESAMKAAKTCTSIASGVMKFATFAGSSSTQGGKLALTYVSASMAKYKKEEPKEPKK